jgi:glycine/D-amino acid oxidase-like deaminating enzyme
MGDINSSSGSSAHSLRSTLPVANPTSSIWQTAVPSPLTNHRTTPNLPSSPVDVLVVGSGITSAFLVDELLEHAGANSTNTPRSILVLEARTLCSGATGRNGGHCIPDLSGDSSHASRSRRKFEIDTWRDVQRTVRSRNLDCEWRELEGCMAWYDEKFWADVKRSHASSPGDEGVEVRIVEGEDGLRQLGLRVDSEPEVARIKGEKPAVGAKVQSVAATCSPYRLVCGLWEHSIASASRAQVDLNIQTTTPVEQLEGLSSANDLWTAHTARGRVSARHVVLATNGYTSALLPEFTGLIVPTQGQMTALTPPTGWSKSRQMLNHDYGLFGLTGQDRVMSDYLVQRPWGNSKVADAEAVAEDGKNVDRKSVRDPGGQFMYGGARQWVRDGGEGTSDDSYNEPDAVDWLSKLGERLDMAASTKVASSDAVSASQADQGLTSPSNLPILAAWTGIMGYTQDHSPFVGSMRDGLWVAAGYTGHGMPNAPGCGRHLARLLSEALEGGNWRDVEKRAVKADTFPQAYVLSEERMRRWMKGGI